MSSGARETGGRALLAVLASMAALLLLGAASAHAAEPDPAAWMYEPDVVVAIDLTLPQASVEALEAVPPTSEYQEAAFSLAETDGTPGGIGEFSPLLTVGIRIKGKAGSFRPLPQKSAFKIKFNGFVGGQKFLGLKKMTLNNMVQDPSMLHETLSYEAFQALGVPGPRTGYAFVRLNGEALGVYLNVEDLDDVGLEKRFGPFDDPQHLYEGEYGTDVRPEEVEDFEVDEGDDEDLSDLEALSAAANDELAPDWSERVEPHADLAEMTRMWAVEKYVGHWDGYAGKADDGGHDLPNNFYLFSDAAGRFQMLPWGTDQTWGSRLAFGGPGGLLFNGCLGDASCAAAYRSAALEVLRSIPSLDLDAAAQAAAELLAPWQGLEADEIRPHDAAEIAAAVSATREFIGERPRELADWLFGPPPPTLIVDPAFDPLSQKPPIVPAPSLQLGQVGVARGALVARFQATAAGRLDLRVTIATRNGRIPACATTASVATDSTSIRCPLAPAVRQRLAARWLRFRLEATLTPVVGAPARLAAARRLARTGAPGTRPQAP